MGKRWIILFSFLVFTLSGVASGEEMERLRHGKLKNGLTYYVKHTGLQKGEVSFYLVQNVGAILEDENENGLAHFLEHMAFNGSEHFPNGLMGFLKNRGINQFNAYTGVEETVYNINNVPVSRTGLTDSCLLILKDWCNGVLLTGKDIEEERGVVIEEWRSKSGLRRRMQTRMAPYLYNESKFSKRNVIGNLEILRSFDPETLRAFYRKWYRPDLQAVIVIGDIDEEVYEMKIRALFDQIPAPENPAARYSVEIADREQPVYALLNDVENKSRSFGIYKRVKKPVYSEEERPKVVLAVNMFNGIWKQRLTRLKNSNAENFLGASVTFGSFTRDYNLCSFDVIPLNGKDKQAFEQVWMLWEEIRRFGFTREEFEQQQTMLLRSWKEMKRNVDKLKHPGYADVCKRNYIEGTLLLDAPVAIERMIEALFELTVEDVNAWLRSWSDDWNLVCIVSGNKLDYPYLTEAAMREPVEQMPRRELSRVDRKKFAGALLDFEVQGGKLKKTEHIKRFDAEIWTLSNGAKVVYKYAEEGRGNFSFVASSKGGRSVVKTEDLPSLTAMQSLVLKSGLYKYDRNTVQDIIGGKNLQMNLQVRDMFEGIGGGTSVENAELFFQFFYLLVEKPIFEKKQFDKYLEEVRFKLLNTPKTPMDLLTDSVQALTTIRSERLRKVDTIFVNDMRFERLEPLFRERFSNAREFIYCIVGDIERDEALRLACKYVGGLSSSPGKIERPVVRDFAVKTLVIEKIFNINLPDDKATVNLSFQNGVKFSKKESLAFTLFNTILNNRYFRTIREEQGGTYGVNVRTSQSESPVRTQSLIIQFDTEKEKVDDLKKLVYAELENVQQDGVTDEEIREIVISMKRDKERASENMGISYWLEVLNAYIEMEEDITSPDLFENIIDTITGEDIQRVTRKFFKGAMRRDFVAR